MPDENPSYYTVPDSDPVELLAVWLNASAARMNLRDVFRMVVKDAMTEARQTYNAPDDEEMSDDYKVQQTIAEFAAKLDEIERIRIEDEQQETDPIGFLSESNKFWCCGCAKRLGQEHKWTRICSMNIGGYSQSCYQCGTLVKDGFRKPDGSPLDLY